ncbi:MAG TPA: alpha/beta hydrolase [Steroidobacter sp.]
MIAVDDISWGPRLAAGYFVTANIPYAPHNEFARLDVYQPCENGIPFKPCRNSPKPTLVFIHGGGWLDDATKETYALWFLPFLQLGWIVVNVEYRPSGVAPAPAAVEDCLGALRWIGWNAEIYNIDTSQLVLAGPSAGAHLALMIAQLASEPQLCQAMFSELQQAACPRPRAVISWCGIVDLVELTEGPARQDFVVKWVGANRAALARDLSPVTHANAQSVPVITAHGDEDPLVPYAQAARFHEALTRAGVYNKLVTLRGSGHAFDANASLYAYPQIFDFLSTVGVTLRPTPI